MQTGGTAYWAMVLIIHGFPNEISGLRFEWAWQHPEKSRRLKHLPKKSRKENQFDYRFRIVSEMLRTAPWNRLALNIQWLKQEFARDFDPKLTPPLHMAVAYGPVKSKKILGESNSRTKGSNSNENLEITDAFTVPVSRHIRCAVCSELLKDTNLSLLRCYQPTCLMVSHIICLAKRFLEKKNENAVHIVPVEGACPKCNQNLLWGNLIRHKHGCYQNLSQGTDDDPVEDDHWTNELLSQVPM
ncbi:structure-specific endonuclease subunit slx1-like isoform X2 [Dreissena polymorpha]|uniref:structure-specific endonuclease subunit slx1-like isoform X2 n=1 Tax=Dreissena polymorpha TaxID=45954 RepID=UPI0022641E88|nr:structure-specific endonuclease subunit slx1-like isoform X2 [Dreissena polymorpha]